MSIAESGAWVQPPTLDDRAYTETYDLTSLEEFIESGKLLIALQREDDAPANP